ncbi:hypothetical protein V6N13_083028 [Hibiscus sabdariffa]|uniref:Uncharacterized protein n=1 Tax=Hibiscus sabdariffa TaxID=183260 RepID=A0ABR2N7A2_9ROSI
MHGVGRFNDSTVEKSAINLEYFENVGGGVLIKNSPEILNKAFNSSVIKKGDILGKLLQPIIDTKHRRFCLGPGNMQVPLIDAWAVNRAAEDGGSLGFDHVVLEADMEMVPNNMEGPSWVESVDLLNNPLSAKDVVAVRNRIVHSEEESFFPELVKSIGKKKYAFLLDLQN